MLYGGIEDSKNGNVGPNGDVYFMKMGSSKLTFLCSFIKAVMSVCLADRASWWPQSLLDLLKFITVTAPVYALFSNASLIFKIKNKKGSISGDFENVEEYRN